MKKVTFLWFFVKSFNFLPAATALLIVRNFCDIIHKILTAESVTNWFREPAELNTKTLPAVSLTFNSVRLVGCALCSKRRGIGNLITDVENNGKVWFKNHISRPKHRLFIEEERFFGEPSCPINRQICASCTRTLTYYKQWGNHFTEKLSPVSTRFFLLIKHKIDIRGMPFDTHEKALAQLDHEPICEN